MGTQKEAIKLAIRDELLGRCRMLRAKGEDVLAREWLYGEFLPSLSPKEEGALEETLAEMVTDGLIEYVSGPKPTYRFTKKAWALMCL